MSVASTTEPSGRKSFLKSMSYADYWTAGLTANLTANVGILYDRARLRQR